jgi:hypothetical protein
MVKDHYVNEYKEKFVGLYDRNSEEFRKDLDRLVMMAYSAGASAEKYRILNRVRNLRTAFAVDITYTDIQKIVSVKVAKYLESIL